MRALRRILFRLGITGKLVIHVGWIVALSLLAAGVVFHLGAASTIRNELKAIETARVQAWMGRHADEILRQDHWKLADAIGEVARDPYAVYAGLFDRTGRRIAQTGDADAYRRGHTLDMVVRLGGADLKKSAGAQPQEPPLPGLTGEVRELPIDERFRAVLEGPTGASEDLLGWVAVTLDTTPLDALQARLLGMAAAIGLLSLAAALLVTWIVARRAALPLRGLIRQAERVARGDLETPMEVSDRPSDEVGQLAAQFGVMLTQLRRGREHLEEHLDAGARVLVAARDAAPPAGAAKVLHDLRNPLASIKAFAEILADTEAPPDPEERARFLGAISEECRRLEEILGAAERERGAAPSGARPPAAAATPRSVLVATSDADLRDLIHAEIAAAGSEVIGASDAVSALRLARERSPEAVILDLFMEEGQAFSILGDLARNHLTGRVPVVTFSAIGDGDRFRPGAVSYQSKPLDSARLVAAARAAVRGATRSPLRVLVADDDRFVAQAIGQILGREGFEAVVAGGGEEAVGAAASQKPDLIVLDLLMPDVGGIEVIRRLRRNPETRESPVILMTGHEIPYGAAVAWPGVSLSREAFVAELMAQIRGAAPA